MEFVEPERKEKKGKYRRPKLSDTGTKDEDYWKMEPFTPESNKAGPFTEKSSFATLFPQYREQYLRQVWGQVTKALDAFGIDCVLNCVEGSMTVSTTRKTWDPYIILKARDLIKLLSRSVPFEQAVRILQDDVMCEVIKIAGYVSSKERFIRRRQRLIGPDGSTLKAIELLTGCYMMVQGNTVSIIGNCKGIKSCRKVIIDCMKNIHPVYSIKTLMIKRELAKDPKLANENWDRFLPKFQKKSKPKKKGENEAGEKKKKRKTKAEKERDYTPFPPPPTERKEDKLIESGEYFLSKGQRKQRDTAELKEEKEKKQALKAEQKEQVFIPPKEDVGLFVSSSSASSSGTGVSVGGEGVRQLVQDVRERAQKAAAMKTPLQRKIEEMQRGKKKLKEGGDVAQKSGKKKKK